MVEKKEKPENKLSLAELFDSDEVSIQKQIVDELISTDNLDRKTELNKPIQWSGLTIIEEFLSQHNLVQSAKIIRNFTDYAFRYLISKDRKGRTEYIEALKNLAQKQTEKVDINKVGI